MSVSQHMALVQQDDAINTFMWKFVLDLDMQILKCLTVTCVIYCVMILLENQCQGSLDVFCSCLGGFTTWCIIIIRCHPYYLLTQLTIVFYTDVCQYSYQVKCIVVPCTVPLAMKISVEDASYFPANNYVHTSRGFLGCDLCVVICQFCVQCTVQEMKIMQSCNDTLASLLKHDCLNMRHVNTG